MGEKEKTVDKLAFGLKNVNNKYANSRPVYVVRTYMAHNV